MKIEVITVRLSFFMFLIAAGGIAAAVSFAPFAGDIFQVKGLRAISFCVLFLGFGEYLNHPVQKKQTFTERHDLDKPPTLHRSRNPCELGNTFDVLAVICLFLAPGLFFLSVSALTSGKTLELDVF